MRVFLVACLVSVVLCIGGYFVLNTNQEPTGIAYATDGARISPHWAWRSVLSPKLISAIRFDVDGNEAINSPIRL